MADIRINALPTTASASSSDDYIALDGTTNGTRKLNAYSPTFGGNLTVNGTGTHSFNGPVSITGTTASNLLRLTKSGAGSKTFGIDNALDFRIYADNGSTQLFKLTDSGDTTLTGNLTVNGTGTSSFAGPVTGTSSTNGYQWTLTGSGVGGPTLALDATNATVANRYSGLALYSGGTFQWALQLRAGDGKFHIYDGVRTVSALTVDVGPLSGVAGTTTVGGNLTVNGSTNLTSSSTNHYIYDGTGWVWTSTGTSGGTVKGGIYTAGGELFITANSSLATNRFALTSSGNATVAGNLTVSGGTIGTAAATNLTLNGGSSGASLALGQGTNGTFTFTLPSISSGSTTWVSAGAVGIGIDFKRATATATLGSTLASLNGYNGATRSTIFEFNGDGATDSGRFDWWVKPTAGSLTQAMVLKSNGNLLIGTTTDGGQKLQVNGTASITGAVSIGSTLNFDTGNAAGTRSIVLGSTYNSGTWLILNGSTEIGSISVAGGFKSNVGFRAAVGSGPTTADYGWASSSGFYSPSANVVSLTASNSRVASWSTTAMTLDYTTDSSSSTTGALTVAGGVGIAKKLYVADNIISTGSNAALFFNSRTGANSNYAWYSPDGTVARLYDNTNAKTLVDFAANTGDATFAGSIRQNQANNISLTSGVATTIFSLGTSAGVYIVTATLDVNAVAGYAIVGKGATGSWQVLANSGTQMSFSMSTNDLQITQSSGSTSTTNTFNLLRLR